MKDIIQKYTDALIKKEADIVDKELNKFLPKWILRIHELGYKHVACFLVKNCTKLNIKKIYTDPISSSVYFAIYQIYRGNKLLRQFKIEFTIDYGNGKVYNFYEWS